MLVPEKISVREKNGGHGATPTSFTGFHAKNRGGNADERHAKLLWVGQERRTARPAGISRVKVSSSCTQEEDNDISFTFWKCNSASS